jgi:Protein of unknown function (DUF3987)
MSAATPKKANASWEPSPYSPEGGLNKTEQAPRPLMRELPPADPFPVDALGTLLGSAAQAIHDRIQAPLAISGQSVLAAATLAVQGHANVELPTGQAKPLSNFLVSVAATGERKTAVDQEALRPCASVRVRYAQHTMVSGCGMRMTKRLGMPLERSPLRRQTATALQPKRHSMLSVPLPFRRLSQY